MDVRVTNDRYDSDCKPELGEVVICIDRSDPVLGNPFFMRSRTMVERVAVKDLHKSLMQRDIARKGPIYRRLQEIAKMLMDGESVCLHCHCAPLPCHGDNYIEALQEMVNGYKSAVDGSSEKVPDVVAARFAAMKKLINSGKGGHRK